MFLLNKKLFHHLGPNRHYIKSFVVLASIVFAWPELVLSQSFTKGDFITPLEIPLKAAAYFGDVRTNHFHSGLDLRTQQTEGKVVRSVADGYVSRIRIAAMGFGYAVYINHPNGYTSVYGHLQRYEDRIEKYIVQKQYQKETFEIDYFPEANELPVKQGDRIGYSGNSGSSEGPHLHFELRETKSERIVNPQLFGMTFADHQAPIIKRLHIYQYSSPGIWTQKADFKVTSLNGNHFLTEAFPITLEGLIGLGIESGDLDDVSGGENSFYQSSLTWDDKLIFNQKMDEFSFSETRYVNASIDYERKSTSGKVIQRLFLLPNNAMSVFDKIESRGIISIKDSSLHIAVITLADIAGNTSSLKLFIKGSLSNNLNKPVPAYEPYILPCFQENKYITDNVSITIPKGYIYDSLAFEYSMSPPPNNRFYSNVHHIMNRTVPVHNLYTISIKTSLPSNLNSKAVMASLTDDKVAFAVPAVVNNGFATASFKMFGVFAVLVDTVAPTLSPINIANSKNMAYAISIRLKISDNLSGIKSFRGTIDGRWVLFSQDGKTSIISHVFDETTTKGKHILKVTLTDQCDNSRTYEYSFSR